MIFPLTCNLLEMDAYSNDFQKIFPAKNSFDCNQIRSNSSYCNCSEPFSFLINQKDIKDHLSKIMAQEPPSTLLPRLIDVSLIQVPVEMSLQRVKLVSLTQLPFGTSLQRLLLVGFLYVPVRPRKNVSNWSVLLAYQFRRDISMTQDVNIGH